MPWRRTEPPRHDRRAAARYSQMVAESVQVTANGPVFSEITSKGRLVDEQGTAQGSFVQRYQLTLGSRVLAIELELDPIIELDDDPWNSYYACRFAWSDEAAVLSCGARMTSQTTAAKRVEAPLFVDIDIAGKHTLILTGGLPYHRRIGTRMLDTLLIVRGETSRQFRLGVGLDVRYPVRAALELLAPEWLVDATSPAPGAALSTWLFPIDSRNVVATSWQPVERDNGVRGTRVRLLETEGRAARVRLRAFHPVRQAYILDFSGQIRRECAIENGIVQLDIHPGQWAEVELTW
jgi:alpha-mannosidase